MGESMAEVTFQRESGNDSGVMPKASPFESGITFINELNQSEDISNKTSEIATCSDYNSHLLVIEQAKNFIDEEGSSVNSTPMGNRTEVPGPLSKSQNIDLDDVFKPSESFTLAQ